MKRWAHCTWAVIIGVLALLTCVLAFTGCGSSEKRTQPPPGNVGTIQVAPLPPAAPVADTVPTATNVSGAKGDVAQIRNDLRPVITAVQGSPDPNMQQLSAPVNSADTHAASALDKLTAAEGEIVRLNKQIADMATSGVAREKQLRDDYDALKLAAAKDNTAFTAQITDLQAEITTLREKNFNTFCMWCYIIGGLLTFIGTAYFVAWIVCLTHGLSLPAWQYISPICTAMGILTIIFAHALYQIVTWGGFILGIVLVLVPLAFIGWAIWEYAQHHNHPEIVGQRIQVGIDKAKAEFDAAKAKLEGLLGTQPAPAVTAPGTPTPVTPQST